MLKDVKATVALLAVVVGGCATMRGLAQAPTPTTSGTKIADVTGPGFESGKARL